jgi:hypothetical protein
MYDGVKSPTRISERGRGNQVTQETEPDFVVSLDTRSRFRVLADQWHEETGGLSSPSQIAAHPAYQQIIAMSESVLPSIFQDLQKRGGHWYLALRSITGALPIPPEAAGRSRQVRELWLQWGRDHGYL